MASRFCRTQPAATRAASMSRRAFCSGMRFMGATLGQEVFLWRTLGSGADLAHQPDHGRNLTGGQPLALLQACEDRLFGGVDHRWAHGVGGNGVPQAHDSLLEDRRRQVGVSADGRHPLDAAAPLLGQPQRLEDAADHAVAQPGHAMGQIHHHESEGHQAGIFDLQPVVEDRQPDRCAPLGIVGVAHCIDGDAMPGMLLHKGDCFLHRLHGEGVDLDPIQDAALVAAGDAPGLDSGIGKVPLTTRRVSRSRRRRARKGANDSEAARKSMASEPRASLSGGGRGVR